MTHGGSENHDHGIRTAEAIHTVFPIFYTEPECGYEPVVSTYWAADPDELPPGVEDVEYNEGQEMFLWTINPWFPEDEGEY